MKCEFELCIYNENEVCGLDEIVIDVLGMCESCVIVNIDKKTLDFLKKMSHID
ncbi:MAG: hypothetical protein FWE33_07300 [Defluviitaleaceae bacterium]|nr:hypothetical protein [Defluviitaleaceae bacterium]